MCSYQSIHEWQTSLVLIEPNANKSASLELKLVVVDLVDLNTGALINHDTIITYDALSYAWGTALPSIECICDRTPILLRDNLDSALKYLRQSENERYVWVDFLCINQSDVDEKAVQIPRMKNIYSKASTVIVWLGESLKVENITRLCEKNCGPNLDFLGCSIHKEQLCKSIMEYAWFKRTWVRQEVWAAESLKVSSPYFTTTWEIFTKKLLAMHSPSLAPNTEAVGNLLSLDELYSSRRVELLALLKQGKGFQASVPHDHIFSVLGMMSTPKHSTKASIPVTYDKTYHEVCGDVTRYIIRESKSLSILKSCTVQSDKTYVFDWPAVKWSYSISDLMRPQRGSNVTSESIEQFEKENPIGKFGTSDLSGNTAFRPLPSPLASRRLLVLYGRAWGTVIEQCNNSAMRKMDIPAYWIDNGTSVEQGVSDRQHTEYHSYFSRPVFFGRRFNADDPVDDNREKVSNFFIFKHGLISGVFGGTVLEHETRAQWDCTGCIRKGDILVELEPGPSNLLLRRCSGLGDLFEVVGWGSEMWINADFRFEVFRGRARDGDENRYYLAEERFSPAVRWKLHTNHAPGSRQQFKIR